MNKLPFLVPQVRLGPSPKIGSMTGGQSNEIRSRMRTRVYYFKIQILERYFLASLDFFLFTKLIFVHQILCQRIKSKMGTKNHFLANLLVMLFCSDICDITSEFREDSCYNFAFRFGRWRNPPAMTWEAGTLVAGRLSSTDNAPGMRSLRPVTSREPSPARPLPIGPFFFFPAPFGHFRLGTVKVEELTGSHLLAVDLLACRLVFIFHCRVSAQADSV